MNSRSRMPLFQFVRLLLVAILLNCCTACDGFLEVELSKSLIVEENMFSTDVTATAALTAIYNRIMSSATLSGSNGVNSLSSLSSGELSNYPKTPSLIMFEQHQLIAANTTLEATWNGVYKLIYQANAVVEGLNSSKQLSATTVTQLGGEARFIRAYLYFYLINLFGDVPLVTETDYHKTKLASRVSVADVYSFIETELRAAQELLSEEYVTENRARPNKATATALLARVYLYQRKYEQAEAQASTIISDIRYSLTDDLSQTFLIGSQETIWQLQPVNPNYNTPEGQYFIVTGVPLFNILTSAFVEHFESGDKRKTNWVNSNTNVAGTFYFPYKYKLNSKQPLDAFREGSVVFRLAEMYLIRAEARTYVGKLIGANSGLSDLNVIRSRAGLPVSTAADKESLLLAIENERWSELFTEYGHRWFDLKRTGRAITVLQNGITERDLLYPIPQNEFIKNPNLGVQNPGY